MRASRPRLASAVLALILAATTAGSINAESTSISASVGASVNVLPLEIALDLSSLNARVGDPVRVRATVTNAGPTRVSNVAVELRVDTSGLSVRGALTATIPRLQPGHATSVYWNLCPIRTGNYLVLARATLGGASIESEARLLTIEGQRKRGC
jgi:subtilase family serine protease